MPRFVWPLPFLAAFLAVCIGMVPTSSGAAAPQPAGRYIVTLQEAAAPTGDRNAAARSLATQLTAVHGGTVDLVYGSALFGFAATMTPAQAKAMSSDPRVRAVEADAPVRTMQPGAK
jgi:hypothetical protein